MPSLSHTDHHAAGTEFQRVTTGLEEPIDLDQQIYPRRFSGCSSLSSNGTIPEMPGMMAFSRTPSYSSDYTPRSTSNLSATPMSVSQSPRCMPEEPSRTGGPSRVSPSSYSSIRPAPYTTDGPFPKRWSTGTYVSPPVKRTSPLAQGAYDGYFPEVRSLSTSDSAFSNNHRFFSTPNLHSGNGFHNIVDIPQLQRNTPTLPTLLHMTNHFQSESESSHSLSHSLQSSVDPCYGQCIDPSEDAETPDLFVSLAADEVDPPNEDMYPEDQSLTPYREEARFYGDLYTPKWIRGEGNSREGWCGMCRPGRWLQLKKSAFWYDRCHNHGVSHATGRAFAAPKHMRKIEGHQNAWEAFCGPCGQWIAMVSAKKRATTWFRHAYKVSHVGS